MKRIKQLRSKYGLSLRKMQEFTGIDFSRLAVIEKTDANMEMRTIDKLCSFFKVSSSYLLGGDGFISYYDETNKKYFDLPYEQYKNILTDDVISFSIENNCVKRIISEKGCQRIIQSNDSVSKALNDRIKHELVIDEIRKLPDFEYSQIKDLYLRSFDIEDIKRSKNKKN